MSVSNFDLAFRRILLTKKLFSKGWNRNNELEQVINFRKAIATDNVCHQMIPQDYPIKILRKDNFKDCRIIEGSFLSPLVSLLPGAVPREVENAYFQLVLPLNWKNGDFKPVCIHLAGTGDHYFWRRRNIMAKPLLKHGIASIVLENPFYGLRKPKDQLRSSVNYVSDIFVMGACLIVECIVLLNWCERLRLGPLCVTGISLGGHMASLAACNWPKPVLHVPCLSWSTASSAFTEGVLSQVVDWKTLNDKYYADKKYFDELSKICKIVDVPTNCQNFNDIASYNNNNMFDDLNEDFTDETDLNKNNTFDITKNLDYISPCEIEDKLTNNNIGMSQRSLNFVRKWYNNGKYLKNTSGNLLRKKLTRIRHKNSEIMWFMRAIMDECTHLTNFPKPYDTSLVTGFCAECDGYVPRSNIARLDQIWPSCEIKYIDCGHIHACLWHQKIFRQAIIDGIEKMRGDFLKNDHIFTPSKQPLKDLPNILK